MRVASSLEVPFGGGDSTYRMRTSPVMPVMGGSRSQTDEVRSRHRLRKERGSGTTNASARLSRYFSERKTLMNILKIIGRGLALLSVIFGGVACACLTILVSLAGR